jgi:hypothetical protein
VNLLPTGAAREQSRRTRLAEFLKAKRAEARPADFDLPAFSRRRVQG